FLSGRGRTPSELSRHLLIRGGFLVLLELTVLRVAWTFNVGFADYLLAGVIWMLGVCMMLMAGLVYLPTRAIAIIGLAVIAAQNLVGAVAGLTPESWGWFWQFVY